MKNLHKITLGLFAGLLTQHTFAVNDNQIRIVNGEDTQLNAYPFMTSLYNKNADNLSQAHGCGASFIGGRYVLTASHCVEGANAKDFAVWIGGHDLTKESQGKTQCTYKLKLQHTLNKYHIFKCSETKTFQNILI